MAKKSKIAKNEQRKIVVARWATRRAELKETIRKPSSSDSERAQAQAALQRLPRD
ncbi:MAG: 30S ribosomal protein S14, partial [Rhodococcus sp. (in: high G+C Gram-positive bacteria)]